MEWKPIDTAPRDGSRILVCLFRRHNDRDFYSPFVANFQEGGWFVAAKGDRGFDGKAIYVQPTYWMPLPKPPNDL